MSEDKHHQKSSRLLDSIIRLHSMLVENIEPHSLFDQVLEELVSITESKYGFIGDILYSAEGQPFLKTQAITNIAWNPETQKLFENSATDGLEFRNLDSLFGQVLKSGKAFISNDPINDPRKGGLPSGHPEPPPV